MVALARSRCAFHLAQERVHLVDAQGAPCPHRAVAGHGREHEVELLTEVQCLAIECEIVIDIAQQFLGIGTRNGMREAAHQHGRGAEALDREAMPRKRLGGFFEAVAAGLLEFDDFGNEQRLASRHSLFRARRFQPFENKAFMRGVLVDEDEPVFRFCDDISVGDLPARDTKWEFLRICRDRCGLLGTPARFGDDVRIRAVPLRSLLGNARLGCRPVTALENGAERGSRLLPDRFRLPPGHGRCIGRLRTSLVTRGQRIAQARNDEAPDRLRIPKAHLGFCRMHVHIHIFRGKIEEQRQDRMAIPRKHVGIGPANSTSEQAILYRSPVDEEVLMVRDPPVVGRQARNPCQPHGATIQIDSDPIVLEFARDDLRHAVRQTFPALEAEDPAIAMIEGNRHIGPSHGKPLHHIEAGGIFAARRTQELAARGDLAEQVFDPDTRSRRQCRRTFGNELAMIYNPFPPVIRAVRAAFEGKARHARNARQGFAAEAQRRNHLDGFIRQFRRRMTFERQRHFLWRHAAAIVGHLEARQPSLYKLDRNPRCARIDGVFDQFLERGRWPFDHFAGGNSVDQGIG